MTTQIERTIENCIVEIHVQRGVLYVHNKDTGATVVRISGLTPEQCEQAQIDVRALQPRSHRETMGEYLEYYE
jgi:hypothetical protein